ncbi:carboxymuconolactone decarboxylase family protein [Paenibacillus campi]|uniref:carboxymuconolactone decarboxylase family protein n=1 Tax=Paenibacillus campi TaxID=3106031 RepID=UPI002B002FA7|nr:MULTISPECIES: carboxymuconolactone decarboxylase family protein [unclassified Paenibacillus]
MQLRLDHYKANPDVYRLMLTMEKFMKEQQIDPVLYELIKIRASQLNRCAYCLDLHIRDLRALGETEERIALLSVWREVPYYTAAERAVLHLTETVTELSQYGVPQFVYDEVLQHYNEQQFMTILMAINTINCWNRIGVATGMFPGCRN